MLIRQSKEMHLRREPTTAVVESPRAIIFTCAEIIGRNAAQLRSQEVIGAMLCSDTSIDTMFSSPSEISQQT
jgi:hypothetical protein